MPLARAQKIMGTHAFIGGYNFFARSKLQRPPALHSKLVQPYCYLGQHARQRHRAARQLQNIRLEMKTGLLPSHMADELPRKPPSGSLSSSFVFLMEQSRTLNNQT